MKTEIFYITGGNGTILQVSTNGTVDFDIDTVTEKQVNVNEALDKAEANLGPGHEIVHSDEPLWGDFSLEEIEDYVGAQ